jgi:DNA-nicking Smr family endonuclease
MNRRPTPDEARLWQTAMDGVKPLKRRKPSLPAPDVAPPPKAVPKPEKKSRTPTADALPLVPPAVKAPVSLDLHADRAPGLDKRSAQRLKRGQMEIDGRIDLHGMTQDRAHRALQAYLLTAADSGRRCVLVITGKGVKPGQESGGVLRQAVPRWLAETPTREAVLAHSSAQPKDGGGGAMYVLLRRRR